MSSLSSSGCDEYRLANILPAFELVRDKGCDVTARGHKCSPLQFQRGHVSPRWPICKRGGTHDCPVEHACPYDFFDAAMLPKDVTENKRPQHVREQWPVQRDQSGGPRS